MKSTSNYGTFFFAVFLFTMLLVVEGLSMFLLWQTDLLTLPLLGLIGGVLGLVTLLLYRGLFPKRPRFLLGKRFAASLLSLCLMGLCVAGSFVMMELDSSLDTMFGEAASLPAAPQKPESEPFIIYLGGSDTRSGTLTKSRNDVNILAAVNPNSKQVLLVNTPRDYYVSNPAGNGAKDKLAHCGLYGLENSKEALSRLYGVPVAYGAVINFKGFEALIDALGGVTIHSDVAFTTTVGGYAIRKGENTLNGAQALAYARERSKLSGGDNTRGENQMQVIAAMVRQLSGSNILSRWRDILDSLEGMFVTDMSLSAMTRLLTSQLGDLGDWEILSVSVTGTGGTDYNWSAKGNAYVMYPDDSVHWVSGLMQRVMDGERLTAEELTP